MEDHSDNEMIPREGTEDQRKKFSLGSAIEVPILLIMFGIALTEAPITNILLYRICVHSLSYPTQDCRALYLDMMRGNKSQAMEDAVQKYSTLVGGVKSVMEALLPAILSLFVVVWSDRHGRKPLLAWSMLGMAGTSFLIVVYAMMEGLGPWWFILCSVPYSLSGGFSILGTAAVCYVTDFTKQNSRSFRLMIVQTTFAVGMAAGNLASPHLLQAMGGVYLLLFAAALLSLGYVFTAIFIKESIPNVTPGSITTVLDFSLVTDMFKECFKRRPNRLRSQILLLTGANSLSTFTVYGSAVISYLYTRRMFDWGLTEFTQYTAVSICISFVGAFLGVAVIQRILPIGDLTFSIIAFLSTSVAFYIRGFAVVSWHMYLSSVVSLFGGLPGPLIRSFLSKALPAEDISSVFGLMGAIEGLCPLVAPVFYNALYAQTIATVPGAVMLVTSGMSLVCVILLGVVVFCRWNSTSTGYEPLQAEA